MRTMITAWHPDLLDQLGVGTIAGTAPLDASFGRQICHRLNREGDSQLNRASYTIEISRLQNDPTTRECARRRTNEGRTGPEIRRCLNRYISREIFRLWSTPPTH